MIGAPATRRAPPATRALAAAVCLTRLPTAAAQTASEATPTAPLAPAPSAQPPAEAPAQPPPPAPAASRRGLLMLVPIAGISNRGPDPLNPNQRSVATMHTLPGIGVGGFVASELDDWPVSAQFFVFTEGFAGDRLQLGAGVGAGYRLWEFTKTASVQAGIALGLDLYREERIAYGGVTRTYRNGLLIGNDVIGCGAKFGGTAEQSGYTCAARSFTTMFTLSVGWHR